MPDILQTDPSTWRYVSEGGATIVFSYKGPSHLDLDGSVLRLRKTPIVPGSEYNPVPFTIKDEPDDPSIEFQTLCKRVIPPEHLPHLETVGLDRPWLEELIKLQDHLRPEARRQKDQINVHRTKGVLATDLVGGKWLAVEIKPKWAFLPSPTYLSEETKALKTQTCRFCMHSYSRAQQGERAMSDYCPLDLYSGNEDRVLKAIHCLWDDWVTNDATANNLKVFAAGKFVRPSEAKSLLAEGQDRDVNLSDIRDAFAIALARPLLQTPVLHIVSHLQRTLDVLDIEGLSHMWKEAEKIAFDRSGEESSPPFTPLGGKTPYIQISEPSISDWNDFLDVYLSTEKSELLRIPPSAKDLQYYLLALLLSATFKDASIIIKLDFLRPEASMQPEIKPHTVTVIDLDPKSLDKLKGWEEMDRDIVRAYLPVEKKCCVDEHKQVSGIHASALAHYYL